MGWEDQKPIKYWIIYTGLVASFLTLLAGTLKLSLIEHGVYAGLSRDNRMVETQIPAARGKIMDRKGRIIANSVYQYFSGEGDNRVFEEGGDFKGYRFEGSSLSYELKRQYPYGQSLAPVSGYVGNVKEGEVKGKSGIEEYFNDDLKGVNGRRLIEVDARGKYSRELGREEPVPGKDLWLSIDAYWQDRAYKLMDNKRAAMVVSEPDTGKVLVLASSPSYDPNDFSNIINNGKIKDYLNDNQNLPLMNRTVAAKYHPGSVFKIVMIAGGLESGVIKSDSLFEDTGVIKVGDYSYSNWLWTKRGGTDGMVDAVKALQRSNDIYFYRLGEAMGAEKIKNWGEIFGMGQKTGIELSGELSGVMPDPKWKKETKGEQWFLGNTYHLSIGQGDLSVTPLQINQMTNIVASGGKKCQMTLLRDKKVECVDLKISSDTLRTIKQGMKSACKPGGTAWPLFNFKTDIACKTGTAEVGDGSHDTHAWLTAYVPADNPQIVITVMVERGGEGSDVAAPIVGDFLKEWFDETETLVPRYTPTPAI